MAGQTSANKKALKCGCGVGEDAEELSFPLIHKPILRYAHSIRKRVLSALPYDSLKEEG